VNNQNGSRRSNSQRVLASKAFDSASEFIKASILSLTLSNRIAKMTEPYMRRMTVIENILSIVDEPVSNVGAVYDTVPRKSIGSITERDAAEVRHSLIVPQMFTISHLHLRRIAACQYPRKALTGLE
jgi:hypothetical protein